MRSENSLLEVRDAIGSFAAFAKHKDEKILRNPLPLTRPTMKNDRKVKEIPTGVKTDEFIKNDSTQ